MDGLAIYMLLVPMVNIKFVTDDHVYYKHSVFYTNMYVSVCKCINTCVCMHMCVCGGGGGGGGGG